MIILYSPLPFATHVYVTPLIVIATTLHASAAPTILGVLSFVMYGALLSHPILVTTGALGAVVSNITLTVPVPLFPVGSVTVTVGLLLKTVPLHTTAHPVLGFGVHTNHGILYVSPLIVPVNVITVDPLVILGLATPLGTLGAIVSTAKLTFVALLVFPAASVTLILPL